MGCEISRLVFDTRKVLFCKNHTYVVDKVSEPLKNSGSNIFHDSKTTKERDKSMKHKWTMTDMVKYKGSEL